ncbi:MAG: flagellar protein FlaG [Gammaproteobacteria bacterium]|jgi:flagellar protein FlaG
MSQFINNVLAYGSLTGVNASAKSQATNPGESNTGKTLPAENGQGGKSGTANLEQAVVQVNDYLQTQRRNLEFSVDKASGETVIKVRDQDSGKVIRQIPAEYMLALAQSLHEAQKVSSTGLKIEG